MTDGDVAFEVHYLFLAQNIADKAHSLNALDGSVIIGGNAATLLSPVLETEKPVVNVTRAVSASVNSKDSAFFMYCHEKILSLT